MPYDYAAAERGVRRRDGLTVRDSHADARIPEAGSQPPGPQLRMRAPALSPVHPHTCQNFFTPRDRYLMFTSWLSLQNNSWCSGGDYGARKEGGREASRHQCTILHRLPDCTCQRNQTTTPMLDTSVCTQEHKPSPVSTTRLW